MGTITEKLKKLADTKAAIKAAIIAKGQSIADSDTFASYADKISAIETGTDTSDANITAADIRSGKVGYGADGKVTGTMADAAVATPTVSVSTAGLITASVSQGAGYCAGGSKSATKQLSAKAAQTYTPGTSNQTIAAQQYLTGAQTIKGDSNLVASNIKSGVSIFGVSGTMEAATKKTAATITVRCYTTDYMYLFYQADNEDGFGAEYMEDGDITTITTYVGAWIWGQMDGAKTIAYNMKGVRRACSAPGDVDVAEVTSSTGTVYFGDG